MQDFYSNNNGIMVEEYILLRNYTKRTIVAKSYIGRSFIFLNAVTQNKPRSSIYGKIGIKCFVSKATNVQTHEKDPHVMNMVNMDDQCIENIERYDVVTLIAYGFNLNIDCRFPSCDAQ